MSINQGTSLDMTTSPNSEDSKGPYEFVESPDAQNFNLEMFYQSDINRADDEFFEKILELSKKFEKKSGYLYHSRNI